MDKRARESKNQDKKPIMITPSYKNVRRLYEIYWWVLRQYLEPSENNVSGECRFLLSLASFYYWLNTSLHIFILRIHSRCTNISMFLFTYLLVCNKCFPHRDIVFSQANLATWSYRLTTAFVLLVAFFRTTMLVRITRLPHPIWFVFLIEQRLPSSSRTLSSQVNSCVRTAVY